MTFALMRCVRTVPKIEGNILLYVLYLGRQNECVFHGFTGFTKDEKWFRGKALE